MILPDGALELIISLGDPQKLRRGTNGTRDQTFRESWISGERTSPIVIDEVGKVDLIGARLRPGGAWPFLGVPVGEFTDQVVELESVMGPEIRYLRNKWVRRKMMTPDSTYWKPGYLSACEGDRKERGR